MNTEQQVLAGKAQQTTVSDELDLRDDLRRDFENQARWRRTGHTQIHDHNLTAVRIIAPKP